MALISEQEIKDFTDLNNNVNAKRFSQYIDIAEKRDIRSLISKPLYDRLIQGVEDNDLTTDEDNLIEKIKPALAWWVLYRALPALHSQITPTGIQTKTSNDGEAVDSKILDIRMKNALAQAEFYSEEMRCWLVENYALFPEFMQSDCCDLNKKTNGYGKSGIVF
jgi:hypothetical protein